MDPKFRRLPKKNERIQQQLLNYPSCCTFLKHSGFRFDTSDEFVTFDGWSAEQEANLNACV